MTVPATATRPIIHVPMPGGSASLATCDPVTPGRGVRGGRDRATSNED